MLAQSNPPSGSLTMSQLSCHNQDREARTTTNITSIDIPVPMPESTEQMSPTLNRQTGSSVETLPVLKPAPIVASELLPVPSSNIPIGDQPANTASTQKFACYAESHRCRRRVPQRWVLVIG